MVLWMQKFSLKGGIIRRIRSLQTMLQSTPKYMQFLNKLRRFKMHPKYFISQNTRFAAIFLLTFFLAIGTFLNSRTVKSSTSASSKIIYIDSANTGLWQIDPDGQNNVRIADAPSAITLVLSPDGQKLAFVSKDENFGSIVVMDINGKETQLVRSNQDQDGNKTQVESLSWSLDGTRLFFARRGTDLQITLHSIKLDGSDEQTIPFEPMEQFLILRISWSPDGKYILIYGTNEQHKPRVVVFNADGTLANVLFEGEKPMFRAFVWSRDGEKLAFTINKDDLPSSTLFIADADGSNVQSVTSGIDILGHIAWSPDKNQIAFWGHPLDTDTKRLFIINADGTDLHSLPLDGYGLVWTTVPE
jgi:Tol biopolymer transport system component